MTIKDELQSVKEQFSSCQIITCTSQILQLEMEESMYRKLKVRMQFPKSYPQEGLLLELSSDRLPRAVLKRMTKQADRQIENELKHVAQVLPILNQIKETLVNNLFLYAFEEVKQIRNLVDSSSSFQMNERKGTIHLKINSGKYYLHAMLQINGGYPGSDVDVVMKSSNFQEHLIHMHIAQAREIARRCTMGYTAAQALEFSNPITAPETQGSHEKNTPILTTKYLKNLKDDVGVLKKITDLRAVNAQSKKHLGGYVSKGEVSKKKAARRELKTLSKDELEKERRLEEELRYQDHSYDQDPTPALFLIANFLCNTFVHRLTKEPCLVCQELLLPSEPPSPLAVATKSKPPKNELRPERVFCGHWYHWKCLNQLLTTPPFDKPCNACQRPLYHPDWNPDLKNREKKWMNKQNKQRELEEVMDCFNLEDEFSAF